MNGCTTFQIQQVTVESLNVYLGGSAAPVEVLPRPAMASSAAETVQQFLNRVAREPVALPALNRGAKRELFCAKHEEDCPKCGGQGYYEIGGTGWQEREVFNATGRAR